MSDATLFEDSFHVTKLDDQKKYDRVTRVKATSLDNSISFSLDINNELYPVSEGDQLSLCIATTLNLDGSKDEKGWRDQKRGESTLADAFDYVCHGRVYRFDEGEGENINVYISFGGLLLHMEGPFRKLTPLRVDYVYLLLKR